MCGLLLALNHDPGRVRKGLQAMSYRGTLPETWAINGPWVLGHTRLPIQTDEFTGVQPFYKDGAALAFVGEIFEQNRPDWSEEDIVWDALSSRMFHRFMELDGFWSLAVLRPSGDALVFTDHLGIKPLYYWKAEGIVCSEIEPMFEVTGYKPPRDGVYGANCIKFGYDHSGRTPWEGIVQIEPGTCLPLHPFGLESNSEPFKYWDWGRVPKSIESLEGLLGQAVENRINGVAGPAVKKGLLLSGGLDSSIIYRLAKDRDLDMGIYTAENGADAQYVRELLRDEDHGINYLSNYGAEDPDLTWPAKFMQAPMDLGSLLPQLDLARAMKEEQVTVVLTGDGADELFGGYRRAAEYDSQHSDVFCELPYYHFPRLDRIHMRFTQEVRSPYLAPAVVKHALELPYSQRTSKQALKVVAEKIGVPSSIIHRVKYPLKSASVLDGGIAHRINLVEAFYDRFETRH